MGMIVFFVGALWIAKITMKINHLQEGFGEIKTEFKEVSRMDKLESRMGNVGAMPGLILNKMMIPYKEEKAR